MTQKCVKHIAKTSNSNANNGVDNEQKEILLQHLTDPYYYDHGRFCILTLAEMTLKELKQFVKDLKADNGVDNEV